jgi:mannose-6-phosphate isomerase-like protein (cupin superfamily)
VTPLNSMTMGPKSLALPAIDGEVMREAVEHYLGNPVFRAARYEERVLDDNPYRRPVRPDDIGLVDFSTPLSRADFAQLSGLMGHRMLLNIYDAGKLLLPRQATAEKWRDYEQFYAERSRFLGDLIRPYLGAHLFGFVRSEARRPEARTATEATARAREIAADRHRQADELREVVMSSPSRDGVIDMLAIQAVATSLNTGIQPTSALRGLVGAGGLAQLPGALSAAAGSDLLLRRVADSNGIKYEPHSYYQYYLPSTLALMNYVNGAAHDPGQVFAFAGALVAQSAEAYALQEALEPALTARLSGVGSEPGALPVPVSGDHEARSPESVADLVERVAGEFGLREFSRGLEEYAVLLDVHHDDRMRQFTWISAMPAHAEKARRLQAAITEHGIKVDLDTFVESCEECSTTHVHDEDRLLVIESGEMEFWNCFGMRHRLRPGDMSFIPKHRLHGSVVLTGECVYHQPVITGELDRRFG